MQDALAIEFPKRLVEAVMEVQERDIKQDKKRRWLDWCHVPRWCLTVYYMERGGVGMIEGDGVLGGYCSVTFSVSAGGSSHQDIKYATMLTAAPCWASRNRMTACGRGVLYKWNSNAHTHICGTHIRGCPDLLSPFSLTAWVPAAWLLHHLWANPRATMNKKVPLQLQIEQSWKICTTTTWKGMVDLYTPVIDRSRHSNSIPFPSPIRRVESMYHPCVIPIYWLDWSFFFSLFVTASVPCTHWGETKVILTCWSDSESFKFGINLFHTI